MNKDCYDEFGFFLDAEGKNVKDGEKNKIRSIVSKMIKSEKYMEEIKKQFDEIINAPDFNIMTDFSVLLKYLINANQNFDYYKEITPERIKFLLYGVTYTVLYKNYSELLNSTNPSDLRQLYVNAMDLVLIPTETMAIKKEDCATCLGRTIKILSFLEKKRKI